MNRAVHRPPSLRRFGAGAALAMASAGLLVPPATAIAATPIDGGPITILPVPIDISAGDQYDPHVSGDIASYTSGTTVHYYDFFTGLDEAVPTWPDTKDELSDTGNNRIAFARLDLDTFNQTIRIYDIASQKLGEVDPQTDPHRSEAATGSDTVAFIDNSAVVGGDLFASRIGETTQQVTADARIDQRPAVSPLGDLVVYESCAASAVSCDIHQAAWNGSAWLVTSLTDTTDAEANPDTDGTNVVYDAVRAGQRDICWQPIGGGVEQCLALAGEQRNPSIAGGVILYEDVIDGSGDLFVYEVASNRRFRITSTPTDETLSDIAKLPDGRLRVVWTAGSSLVERDVYGATITLPTVGPTYTFGGFQQPVDARPTLNQMKAGGAVPVKFSLGGNQGLSIFAAGFPKSQAVACDTTANVDGIEQTVTAGGSSLGYDALTATYTYVWKTDRAWAGTCRQLVLAFADGSVQRATFQFK
jgi:hypothetical protein